MKKEQINQKGITLISLVVTIVVMIILAGVGINLLLGQNGIIHKTLDSKEQNKIGQLLEKLDLEKGYVAIDKQGVVKVDEYISHIEAKSIIAESDKDIVNEDTTYITVDDGYIFLVEKISENDIKIEYKGKEGTLGPIITKIDTISKTNSINMKVKSLRTENYEYYIKKSTEGNFVKKYEGVNAEYTFEGLEQNINYDIKVVVKNKNGEEERIITRITKEMSNLTQAEVEYIIEPNTWTNGNVTTKIKLNTEKDVEGLKIQYIKVVGEVTSEDLQEGNWKDYKETGIITEENETIYSRLYDGINTSSYTSRQIMNIDKIIPVITQTSGTTNSVIIKATDEASGIIGYAVTESNIAPTEFIGCTNTKLLDTIAGNLTQNKTYYVWVKDNAGNISISKTAKTNQVTSSEGNITFNINPNVWTNGSVTVTANTTLTDYKIQTSINGTTWDNKSSQTITENGTIYARLVDSTNQANGYASRQVGNIDKTLPIVTDLAVTTNNIAIKGTDEASGIIGYAVTTTNIAPTAFISCTNTKSLNVTVGSLIQNTTYYVWVKDEAGNVSISKTAKTNQIASSTENIIFNINPSVWTNGSVIVTASTTLSGYTVQTSLNATSWEDKVSQTITTNGGTVYARLKDSTNQTNGYTSRQITNIDKLLPIVTELTVTTNNINIKATEEASGIIGYAVTTTNTVPTTFTSCTNTKALNVTIGGLVHNTTYYVWVKDEAGNVSISKSAKTEHEHNYVQSGSTTATCTAAGISKFVCTICNDSYTQSVAALGHNYKASTVAATCLNQGYTLNRCARCGTSYNTNYTSKLGHNLYNTGIKDYDSGRGCNYIMNCYRCPFSNVRLEDGTIVGPKC